MDAKNHTRFRGYCKTYVPDQIGILSQVRTSSYMAYAMQELTQGVSIWLKKFLLGPVDAILRFMFCLFFVLYMYSVRIYSQGGYFQIRRSGGLAASHQVWRQNLG